jgi:hypothetical protein
MPIERPKPERSPPNQALSSAIPEFIQSGIIICYISLHTLFKWFLSRDRVDRFGEIGDFP